MASRLKRSMSRGNPDRQEQSAPIASGTPGAFGDLLDSARRKGESTALFLVNLNNFHVINNGLGRAFGDAVIEIVTKRLAMSVQNLGHARACGGDSFMVVVSEPGEGPDV